jgi:hypothetical protein
LNFRGVFGADEIRQTWLAQAIFRLFVVHENSAFQKFDS